MKKLIIGILYANTMITVASIFFVIGFKIANNNQNIPVTVVEVAEEISNKSGDNGITIPLSNITTTRNNSSNTITYTTTVTTEKEEYYVPPIYGVTLEEAEKGDINNRKKYIWDFFVSLGYNEVSTSAIIGNMMIEDPTLTGNNDSKSYNDETSYTDGIIQWDPFDQHMIWADQKGYEYYNLEGQLYHVDDMIRTSWQQNRVDQLCGYYNNIIELTSITWEEFIICDNVAIATAAFERGIEGSHDWQKDNDNKRITSAYSIYDELSEKNNGGI